MRVSPSASRRATRPRGPRRPPLPRSVRRHPATLRLLTSGARSPWWWRKTTSTSRASRSGTSGSSRTLCRARSAAAASSTSRPRIGSTTWASSSIENSTRCRSSVPSTRLAQHLSSHNTTRVLTCATALFATGDVPLGSRALNGAPRLRLPILHQRGQRTLRAGRGAGPADQGRARLLLDGGLVHDGGGGGRRLPLRKVLAGAARGAARGILPQVPPRRRGVGPRGGGRPRDRVCAGQVRHRGLPHRPDPLGGARETRHPQRALLAQVEGSDAVDERGVWARAEGTLFADCTHCFCLLCRSESAR